LETIISPRIARISEMASYDARCPVRDLRLAGRNASSRTSSHAVVRRVRARGVELDELWSRDANSTRTSAIMSGVQNDRKQRGQKISTAEPCGRSSSPHGPDADEQPNQHSVDSRAQDRPQHFDEMLETSCRARAVISLANRAPHPIATARQCPVRHLPAREWGLRRKQMRRPRPSLCFSNQGPTQDPHYRCHVGYVTRYNCGELPHSKQQPRSTKPRIPPGRQSPQNPRTQPSSSWSIARPATNLRHQL